MPRPASPLPPAKPVPVATQEESEERGFPRFRPEEFMDPKGRSEAGELTGVERPGLRDEEDPEGWPSPELRIEFFLPALKGEHHGVGGEISLELALAKDEWFRVSYLQTLYSVDKDMDDGMPLSSQHLSLEYICRIAGFTRHAVFDLAVRAGFGLERFSVGAVYEGAENALRLSPSVGLDVGIWQGGPIGAVFHLGQTIPVNFTGNTSSTTEVKAFFRWDVTEKISLQAGYRLLRVRLRDYDHAFAVADGRGELEATMRGPLIGVDVRF